MLLHTHHLSIIQDLVRITIPNGIDFQVNLLEGDDLLILETGVAMGGLVIGMDSQDHHLLLVKSVGDLIILQLIATIASILIISQNLFHLVLDSPATLQPTPQELS